MQEKTIGEDGTETAGSLSSEVNDDLTNVKAEVKQLMKSIRAFSTSVSQDVEHMKTVVDRTFDIVVDTRYKVLQNIYFLTNALWQSCRHSYTVQLRQIISLWFFIQGVLHFA